MKKLFRSLAVALASVILLSAVGCASTPSSGDDTKSDDVTPTEVGAFYVSVDGSDENDGSENAPFATIERAAEAARASEDKKTVYIHAGTYMTEGLNFTDADNGCSYVAYGDGEVNINGGAIVKGSDFVRPSDEFIARLSDETAKEKVMCVDLTKHGITKEQIGAIHAVGSYGTANKYDGDYVGDNCEVFWNDGRMTLARYPNDKYFHLAGVIDQGDPAEYPQLGEGWSTRRNHDGGIYRVGESVINRMATWADITNVWMFGYFFFDWADSSTPLLGIDVESCGVMPKFVSFYGAISGASYYFYNIPEEMDIPGEYYIDRENCILYVYPTSDIADGEALISVSSNSIITATDVDGMEFKGLTILGSKNNGMDITGSNVKVTDCVIKNVAGIAVSISGNDCTVSGCDVSHTGRGGNYLNGGDIETLTPANNLAYNNYVHDWSEIYQTYQAGIKLTGVGCTASHNELCNSPHLAISFSGNDHIMEYNYIHDVVLYSGDAGAIYTGQNWSFYGSIIRYNIIRDLGTGDFTPVGVYLDDGLSGTTVQGNLIINTKGSSIGIGGGRDNKVFDNIVINVADGLTYDSRLRDGFFDSGWAKNNVISHDSYMWTRLYASPYKSEIWAEKYPHLAATKDDFDVEKDDPDFPPNPAYVEIYNNVFFSKYINICGYIQEYGKVENNTEYELEKALEFFPNYESGDYTCTNPDGLPEIPFDEIGRITK